MSEHSEIEPVLSIIDQGLLHIHGWLEKNGAAVLLLDERPCLRLAMAVLIGGSLCSLLEPFQLVS